MSKLDAQFRISKSRNLCRFSEIKLKKVQSKSIPLNRYNIIGTIKLANMSFRIAASPTRRKRSTSGLQTIKLNRSHSISTTVELVDEIKQLIKLQCDEHLQQLVLQLCTLALNLECKALQPSKKQSELQSSNECTPINTTERRSSRDSPLRRPSAVRKIEMVGSWKFEPTLKQKFALRKNSMDIDQMTSKEPNRRLLQDSGDIQFLQSMLSLNQESQKLSPSIIKIHKLISINDSELHQNLEKMDLSSFTANLMDPLRFCKEFIFKAVNYINKLKKIVQLAVSPKTSLAEQISHFSRELQSLYSCDRVLIYIYDDKQHILWTKNPDNNQRKIQPLKGLHAYIIKTGQMVNIYDVNTDVRFDHELDNKQPLKSKSLLAAPIMTPNSQIIGIVLLISTTFRQFKKDEEQILEIVNQVLALALLPFTSADLTNRITQSLQSIVHVSLVLSSAQDQRHLILITKEIIQRQYDLKGVQIFVEDVAESDMLCAYELDGRKQKVSKLCGIVGHVFKSQQTMFSESCYQDLNYNQFADLQTNLPVVTMPLKNLKGEIIGVLQYIDERGIDNYISKACQRSLTQYELIQIFSMMFAYIYGRFVVAKPSQKF